MKWRVESTAVPKGTQGSNSSQSVSLALEVVFLDS